jgi:hypothetical protein
MTEVLSDMEMFEIDCAHTSEVVMGSLCSFKNNNAFLLTDVNEALFESSFLDVVARYLGGRVVDRETITFMGKTITFEFTVNRIIYGNIEELEVIYVIT